MQAVLALFLAVMAIAAPTTQQTNSGPNLSTSKGFRLVLKLTDLARDFIPSINNYALGGYHIGAGLDAAVFSQWGDTFFDVSLG